MGILNVKVNYNYKKNIQNKSNIITYESIKQLYVYQKIGLLYF